MLIYGLFLKQNYIVFGSQVAIFIEFLLCVRFLVARRIRYYGPCPRVAYSLESMLSLELIGYESRLLMLSGSAGT